MPQQKNDPLVHPAGVALVPEFHRGFHREPVTGSAAYRYLRSLPDDVTWDAVKDRGLRFGDAKVSNASAFQGMELSFGGARRAERMASLFEYIFRREFEASGLERHMRYITAPKGPFNTLLRAVVDPDTFVALSDGRLEVPFNDGSGEGRSIAELSHFGGEFTIAVRCQEAADAAFAALREIGLRTTPAHHSNEGSVPHTTFVDHALLWHDTANDKWFGEILWEPRYKKSLMWRASTVKHLHVPMGPSREAWAFASTDRPRIRINNVPVRFIDISVATTLMDVLQRRSLKRSDFWAR